MGRSRKRKAPKAQTKAEKCRTPYCRNRRAKETNGSLRSHCWKCESRKFRESRPATYTLNNLRRRARQRKIPFSITLEQWEQFCEDTGYLHLRGREPSAFSVDRKNHDEGYHIWNIQVKNNLENAAAGHTVPGRATHHNTPMPQPPDDNGMEREYTAAHCNESVPF